MKFIIIKRIEIKGFLSAFYWKKAQKGKKKAKEVQGRLPMMKRLNNCRFIYFILFLNNKSNKDVTSSSKCIKKIT